eukprot:388270-Prymnesium_polylepis.1
MQAERQRGGERANEHRKRQARGRMRVLCNQTGIAGGRLESAQVLTATIPETTRSSDAVINVDAHIMCISASSSLANVVPASAVSVPAISAFAARGSEAMRAQPTPTEVRTERRVTTVVWRCKRNARAGDAKTSSRNNARHMACEMCWNVGKCSWGLMPTFVLVEALKPSACAPYTF